MITAADTSRAVEFLSNWKPEGPWPLCAFHEDGSSAFATFGPRSTKGLTKWLKAQTLSERNIYFHVNSVNTPKNGKAQKGQVVSIDWLHVDVDPKKGQDLRSEQERILAQLQNPEILPKPTVIIFSGGGYQSFWKLAEPLPVNGDLAKIEDAEQYNVQISRLLQADACHNADRIMRLPGTINWPNQKKRDRGQKPVRADVVLADWDTVYPIAEFMKAPERSSGHLSGSPNQVKVEVSGNVPRLPSNALSEDKQFNGVDDRAKVAIVQGHDPDQPLTGDNSRSEWLWYVVCELVRAGVDDDTVYSIITDPDFGISEHVKAQGNAAAQHRCAMRSIQRAKEFAINPWLAEINSEYATIESLGGRFRIACERYSNAKERYEVEFHLPDGFLKTWGNKFIEGFKYDKTGKVCGTIEIPVGKWWLAHPNRREYREVTFYPNHDIKGAMNLWRGFSCDAVPGNCQLYLDHIKKVMCKGNQLYYDYLIGWMANAVQNPHLPGQVAIVMRGGQGTGKGTFAAMFGKLFGTHYKQVTNPEHVTGTFNAMLADCAVLFADECFVANDKAAEGALKSLITEATIRVTPKGVDNMEARNCTHLLMATNRQWAVSADLDDRRFFILDVDDCRQVDTKYFGAMHEQMKAGGYEALLHMLMTYDLSKFDVFNCPKTSELRRQQDQSMEDMPAFLLHVLEEGRMLPSHSGWRNRVLKEAVVDQFKSEHPRFRTSVNHSLGIFLAKFGVTSTTGGQAETWVDSKGQKRQSAKRPKLWLFPELAECRTLWETVTRSGPRVWAEVTDEPDDEVSSDGGNKF